MWRHFVFYFAITRSFITNECSGITKSSSSGGFCYYFCLNPQHFTLFSAHLVYICVYVCIWAVKILTYHSWYCFSKSSVWSEGWTKVWKTWKTGTWTCNLRKVWWNRVRFHLNFFIYDFDYKTSYLHGKNSSTETVY